MRLAAVCDIHSGYTARGRLEPQPEGGVPALQLRDVSSNGETLSLPLQRYEIGKLAQHYFVRGGEVVFRSRGEPNAAVAIRDTLPEPIVVIVPLVIIRPDREKLLPEYLAWAINQPDAQRRLGAEAQGTSLRMIPMTVLENLDIPVPELRTQNLIVELAALARQEGRLLHQLATRREHLVTSILGEAAKLADRKENG
ncbi:restriction endonuclease subunit S [Stappia sp. TSB10GB4]|uniref:restriction endonuclease subunit S n=1 Tax=Stappia sp. TSB10GB4 TaxID=2003584 RepID=UPI0016490930|nr:restriction endonuclease subunit S [Stappia sp. TSB10GB4]